MDRSSLDKTSFHGKARTQFLANLADIKKALDDGYPAAAIWRELQRCGTFDAKYAQFMIYVKNYVVAKKTPTEPLILGAAAPQARVQGAYRQDSGDPELLKKQQASLIQKGLEKRTMSFMDMNIDGVGELLEPYKNAEDLDRSMKGFESKKVR